MSAIVARSKDVNRFYSLLESLRGIVGSYRFLASANKSSGWPRQGVYFFFEPGEFRSSSNGLRVVRVGSHAVSANSSTTLWNRLSQHKGTSGGQYPGGGNHRGSIFRWHVGTALLNRDPGRYPEEVHESWRDSKMHSPEAYPTEYPLEREVSNVIGRMPFLWVAVPGPGGSGNARSFIEANSIRLLSNIRRHKPDTPSLNWLGRYADHSLIKRSGLWNIRETEGEYDPAFLDDFEQYIKSMQKNERPTETGYSSNFHMGPSRTTPTAENKKVVTSNADESTLVIIPCGARKIWKDRPKAGPTPARLAYTGPLSITCKEFAETSGHRWIILSAKYGFVDPDFPVEDYDTTFSKPNEETVPIHVLRNQVREKELWRYKKVIAVGGQGYLNSVRRAFADTDVDIDTPAAGLPIGKMMSRIKELTYSYASPSKSSDANKPSSPRDNQTYNIPVKLGADSNLTDRATQQKTRAPKSGDFREALEKLFALAKENGAESITVRSGDLHRKVGGYPGPHHRMVTCCNVMRSVMGPQDEILEQPPAGNGANLLIQYRL